MNTAEMLEKSIIVAAHPDDEVLWFSSILDKVDEIIFCYSDVKSKPQWTVGRKQSLAEYPLKNITCLGMNESEVFNDANFYSPVITKYGIAISQKGISDKKYIENYYKLKEDLGKKLIGCQNVFTHNPWGEYGNEEHIQIYRVVKELQEEMKFNLWFSNYCSNKSFNLMTKYISVFDSEYVTLKTNKILSGNIKKLYEKNECWTWYDDWEWLNEETFIKDTIFHEAIKKYGHMLPINLINVKLPTESRKEHKIFSFLISKISRNLNKMILPMLFRAK